MKKYVLVYVWIVGLTLTSPHAANAAIVLYGAEADEPYLTQIDPANAAAGSSTFVEVLGLASTGLTGAAADPLTGDIYLVLDNEEAFHRLVRHDPRTGKSVDVGNIGELITGIAFDSAGTLYGVTSDTVSGTPDTIFTIDKTTAVPTVFMSVPTEGIGTGDTLAFNPADGKLYHWSGSDTAFFTAIDLADKSTMAIALSGDRPAGVGAISLVYDTSQGLFVGYRQDELGTTLEYFTITSTGFQSFLSSTGFAVAGLAFLDTELLPPVPAPGPVRHLYSVDVAGPYITSVDPASGSDTGVRAITLSGFVVTGSNGLAIDPTTGVLYASIRVTAGGRRLVTLDPATGTATLIGTLQGAVASIAFDASGTLYAVTGEGGGALTETLFTVNKSTATMTPILSLSDDDGGEAIAFNTNDGMMYRASGWTSPIFERINLSTDVVTDIPLDGDTAPQDEVTALAYDPEQDIFIGSKWTSSSFAYFTVTPNGLVSNIVEFTQFSPAISPKKGYAFSLAVQPDADGDGVPDSEDAFPNDPSETTDTDNDGLGNNADPDDDNDGVLDAEDDFPLGRFSDAEPGHWAFVFIEALARAGITAGCGGGNYCPEDTVTRAQMAVFLERGINGSAFTPPAASGAIFDDVDANDFAAAFIEQLSADGITSGCGGGNYCPGDGVTRAQMAVFLLRAKHGAGYMPPAATGVFGDVPISSFADAWIEQLAAEGITSGCGGGNYCPSDIVTRAQMAVFLVRTFGL